MNTQTPASGTPLAFSNPSSGKIDQQRKILEELERQKKLLSKNSGSAPVPTSSNSAAAGLPASSLLVDPANALLTSNQRSALEAASKTSFGYFIAQDSSFGNTILPVIPRPLSSGSNKNQQ